MDFTEERDREVVEVVPEYAKPYTVLTPQFYCAGLELNPNNAKSWFELGLLLVDDPSADATIHGKQHAAKDCFELAVRIFPQDAEAWFRLGICLQGTPGEATDIIKGLHLGARECFEQCVRNKPDNHAAWYNIGVLLGTFDRTNRIGDAYYERHECFHKTLCLDDSDAMAWFNLGVSLPPGKISGEIGGVGYAPRQCFEQSILRNPRDPDVWYNLGCALSDEDELSIPLKNDKRFNRQQCFELALRMDPHHKAAWYNLGVLLSPSTISGTTEGTKSHSIQGSKRYSARECFEEAVKIDPMWPAAWFNLGQCVTQDGYTSVLLKGKQYSKTQCFEVSLRLDPKSAEAWAALGLSLEDGCYSSSIDDTGKRFSKQRCFESALGLDVNNALYWYYVGLTLQHVEGTVENGDTRRHKWTREIEGYTYNQQLCFERSLMLDPSPAAVWNDLGIALPASPDATTNLLDARCYKKQHCFEASLERDSTSPSAAAAWYNLAVRLALHDQRDVGTDKSTEYAKCNSIQGATYTRRQCLEHALVLDNLHAEAWLQLGIVLPDPAHVAASAPPSYSFLEQPQSSTTPQVTPRNGQYERSFIHGDRVGKQDCLERCLRLGTLTPVNEAEAWNRLGVVLAQGASVNIGGVVYDKRLCFERSLTLDVLQAEPWFNLGVSLPRGEVTAALGQHRTRFTEQGCFEQALRRNPDHPSAWHNLGTTLSDDHVRSNPLTKSEDAVGFTRVECFRKAVELERIDWEHWSSLGECLLREDQRRLRTFTKSIHTSTNGGGGAAAGGVGPPLASVVIFEKRWTALECATRAVEYSNGRSPEAWVNLGRALPPDTVLYSVAENRYITRPAVVEIAGRPHTKQACYEGALGLNPRHVYAWYHLGCVLPPGGATEDLGGHTYSEQECFEQVLRFDEHNAEAWYNVGLLIGDPLHHRASCAPKYWDTLSNDISGHRYSKQACFEACLFHTQQKHAGAWYYLGMVLPRDRSILGRPYRHPSLEVNVADDEDEASGQCVSKQECFEHALSLAPDDGKAWCELALLLPERGGLSNAISGRMYSKSECMEHALELQYDARAGEGAGTHVYLP